MRFRSRFNSFTSPSDKLMRSVLVTVNDFESSVRFSVELLGFVGGCFGKMNVVHLCALDAISTTRSDLMTMIVSKLSL